MDESAQIIDKKPGAFGLSRRAAERLSLLALVGLIVVRAAAELSMMSVYGNDAQMGIWYMHLVANLVFWFVAGALAVWLMLRLWPRRWAVAVCATALVVWSVAIGNASWKYYLGRQALADAASRETSPERLSELVHFDGIQAGYELDNRLASNENTPVEALRELAQKRDQLGTQMKLAKNPNTPADVREQLWDRP